MTEQQLAGLRIVVTRPREQAASLAQGIASLGGQPILFPLLEIEPLGASPELQGLLARLTSFDLAIFISPNAVQYGMALLRAAGGLPPNLRVATVGQGSARALQEAGVAQVIAPTARSDSEALLELPELQQVRGSRVVIFRGEEGRELLADTLRARGAAVEYAACYRRRKPDADFGAVLAQQPHAITVSSSEAVAWLTEMVPQEALSIPLFASHARIAENASRLGWRNVVEVAGGDDGILSGLVAWADDKSRAVDTGSEVGESGFRT